MRYQKNQPPRCGQQEGQCPVWTTASGEEPRLPTVHQLRLQRQLCPTACTIMRLATGLIRSPRRSASKFTWGSIDPNHSPYALFNWGMKPGGDAKVALAPVCFPMACAKPGLTHSQVGCRTSRPQKAPLELAPRGFQPRCVVVGGVWGSSWVCERSIFTRLDVLDAVLFLSMLFSSW